MFLIFRFFYNFILIVSTVNYIFSLKFALKTPGFLLSRPLTNYQNRITSVDPNVPLDQQFEGASELNNEESSQISEEAFKAASVSAVQLAGTGVDWIKILDELKESSDCAVNTDTLAYNAALTCAVKNSDFDKAMELFKEMKKEIPDAIDVVTYKTLLLACELAGKYEHGVALYNDFLVAGLSPDYGLLSSVLRCCSHQGHNEYSSNVFLDIKRLTDPKIIDYENIIRSCIKSDDVSGALKYFEQLSKTAHPKEIIISISDLIRYGSFTMNTALINQMLEFVMEKNIDIGKNAFVDLLQGLYNCNDYDQMSSVWNKMYDLYQEDRDGIACKLMLKKCMSTGECREAAELLKEMENYYKEDLDENAFLSAIGSCITCGESKLAINFLRKGQSSKKCNLSILNAVYKACEKSESWEDIINLYEQNIHETSNKQSRDVLESKIYYLLANYKMNKIDKVKEVITELSKLQKYSFPYAIKVQKYIQQCVTNNV